MSRHDFRPLRARLEAVLSEMLDCPAYVVLMSESGLVPCLTSEHSVVGLTGHYLHRALQPAIGDRWRGPGKAMLVAADQIAADYRHRSDAEAAFASIVAHEAGHLLAFGPVAGEDDCAWMTGEKCRPFLTERVESPAALFAEERFTPRSQHGPDWIRAVIHIAARLRGAGFEIHLPMAIDREIYAISAPIDYVRALGDEPEHLHDVPLTDIAAIPMPAAFLDLWNSDLARWPDSDE